MEKLSELNLQIDGIWDLMEKAVETRELSLVKALVHTFDLINIDLQKYDKDI